MCSSTIPSPKFFHITPWKVTLRRGKDRLPTTIFQGQAVKLQECTPPKFNLKFNMEMMELMGFPSSESPFSNGPFSSILRFPQLLEADIERKTGFVGSGKGLKQLLSQKAGKWGKMLEKKSIGFFADKRSKISMQLFSYMILYIYMSYVMYIYRSMYSFCLGRGGQGCFGHGEMHESMRFCFFC